MTVDARVNLAYGVVTSAPSPATSGTSMVVSGHGTFPTLPANAIVHAAGATEAQIASGGEFVRVTANASGTLTIVRATEGPNAARTIVNGDIIKFGLTKKTIDDILAGGPFTGMIVTPAAASTDRGLQVSHTLHGSVPSDWYAVNHITIDTDDADTNDTQIYDFLVYHEFGGSNMNGGRVAVFGYLNQTAVSDQDSPAGSFLAGQFIIQSESGDGGTNTGAGARGSYFAMNPNVRLTNAANSYIATNCEFDMLTAGTTTARYIMNVMSCSGHVAQGALVDAAYEIHTLGLFDTYGPGVGFRHGLMFAELGNGLSPISSDGTLIGSYMESLSTMNVARGIDFRSFTFSGNAIETPGFYVSNSGSVYLTSTVAYTPAVTVWNKAADATGGYLLLQSTRGTGPTQAGDTLGTVAWYGNDTGSTLRNSINLQGVASAVGGSSVTSRLEVVGGDLYIVSASLGATGQRVVKGWFTDLEVTNAPTLGGVAIPSISSTNTLTNKRVTKRTGTTTSSATPTINSDNVDIYYLTAQTVDINTMSTNLSGTPTLGQMLLIGITGTAARAITWGASFVSTTVTLPTTTVTTATLLVLFIWDGAHWACVGVA